MGTDDDFEVDNGFGMDTMSDQSVGVVCLTEAQVKKNKAAIQAMRTLRMIQVCLAALPHEDPESWSLSFWLISSFLLYRLNV